MVRLKGVLTPAERQLAKTVEGVDMVKRLRQNLIALGRDKLCEQVSEITGAKTLALFTDIDVQSANGCSCSRVDRDIQNEVDRAGIARWKNSSKASSSFEPKYSARRKSSSPRLSENQAPRALFITCSDSRVDPTLLTQTDPGELFILRNAGNMVPPYGSMQGGSTATIEYAMAVLKVPHIMSAVIPIVRVMKALLHPEDVHDLPAVKEWVGQAETTRRLMREHYTDLQGNARLIKTTQENVRSQLRPSSHPSVRRAAAAQKESGSPWVGLFHLDRRCMGL